MAAVMMLWALLAVAAASPMPQEIVQDVPVRAEQEEILSGTVILRPPRIEKVTQVTTDHQYQKLYKQNGKYKFGFDDEEQFRVEERLPDGQLRGIYGYTNKDGTYEAFMYEQRYTYDGEKYKQVPYTVDDIPEQLRLANEAQGPARFVRLRPEPITAEPEVIDLESDVVEAAQ